MTDESNRPIDSHEDLIDKLSPTVYRLALSYTKNRHDAEDVMQEVFLRYVKKQRRFDGFEHQKAWFLRVTINCCKTLFSRSQRVQVIPLHDLPELCDGTELPDIDGAVTRAVLSLPAPQRLCIHLFYYEDQPVKEIVKITGLKESTVKSHLRRGRAALEQTLKGEYSHASSHISHL